MSTKFKKELFNLLDSGYCKVRSCLDTLEKESIQSVRLRKHRGTDSYDVIISVDDLEVNLYDLKSAIDTTAESLNININKLFIEL